MIVFVGNASSAFAMQTNGRPNSITATTAHKNLKFPIALGNPPSHFICFQVQMSLKPDISQIYIRKGNSYKRFFLAIATEVLMKSSTIFIVANNESKRYVVKSGLDKTSVYTTGRYTGKKSCKIGWKSPLSCPV
jgi:hypothetical protein